MLDRHVLHRCSGFSSISSRERTAAARLAASAKLAGSGTSPVIGTTLSGLFNTLLLQSLPWRQAILGGTAIAFLLLPLLFLVVRELRRSHSMPDLIEAEPRLDD